LNSGEFDYTIWENCMERILTVAEALHEALEQEMARDPAVVVLGQGVDDFKGFYGTTRGLVERFGPNRVMDTPLSEEGMTGAAIGMALAGMRPVHSHIRFDFARSSTSRPRVATCMVERCRCRW
jgi:pyruvate dehydrogenase E1 component beta subunit